jgi:hypothetical protein
VWRKAVWRTPCGVFHVSETSNPEPLRRTSHRYGFQRSADTLMNIKQSVAKAASAAFLNLLAADEGGRALGDVGAR